MVLHKLKTLGKLIIHKIKVHTLLLFICFMGLLLLWFALKSSDFIAPLGSFFMLENIVHDRGYSYYSDLGDQEISSNEKKTDTFLYEIKSKKGTFLEQYIPNPLKDTYTYNFLKNTYAKRFPNSTYDTLIKISTTQSFSGDIQEKGEGRYSIWRGFVYFSTPDKTSPIKNGRKYLVLIPLISPDFLQKILFYTIMFIGFLLFSSIAVNFLHRSALIRNILPGILVTLVLGAGLILIVEYRLKVNLPFLTEDNAWPGLHDEVAGFIFQPGATLKYTNGIDFSTLQIINSLGFLDYEPVLPKPQGLFRILIIGDSFVEAAQVDKEYKLQTQLTKLISENNFFQEQQFDVVAMGYSGTGQANQYSFYEKYGKLLEPDLVILIFVGNDFANNSPILETVRNGWHPYKAPRLFFSKDEEGNLKRYSINMEWQKHILKTSGMKDRVEELRTILKNKNDIELLDELLENKQWTNIDSWFWANQLPQVYQLALEQTALALEQWLNTAKADGFPLIVVAAENVTFQGDTMSEGFNKFNQINRLRAITNSKNLPLLDLQPYFKTKGDYKASKFLYDSHWNKNGHRWGAEALYQYLVENDFFRTDRK